MKNLFTCATIVLILGQAVGIFIKDDYLFSQIFYISVLIFQIVSLFIISKIYFKGSLFIPFCYGLWVYDFVRVLWLNPHKVDYREYLGFIVGSIFLLVSKYRKNLKLKQEIANEHFKNK